MRVDQFGVFHYDDEERAAPETGPARKEDAPVATCPRCGVETSWLAPHLRKHRIWDTSVECPHCHRRVPPDLLSEHRRRLHPSEYERAVRSASANAQRNGVPRTAVESCPVCRSVVESRFLATHVRLRHPKQLVAFQKRQQSPLPAAPYLAEGTHRTAGNKASPKRQLTPCEVCSVQVRVDRLARHTQSVHPLDPRPPAAPVQRMPRPGFVERDDGQEAPARRGNGGGSRLAEALGDGLDGGRFLGFAARENGRFGSYPSFDDYGDESSP